MSPLTQLARPRQTVVEQQTDDSRHGNIQVHRRDPIVGVRLELVPGLADVNPALEVVVGIGLFLERDDFGKFAAKEGKSSSRTDYTDGHVVLVQDKHTAVKTRLV